MKRIAYFTSDNGERAVEIARQDNGFFRWVGYELYPGDEGLEPYLYPVHFSGLYDDGEAAERDAFKSAWLDDAFSN